MYCSRASSERILEHMVTGVLEQYFKLVKEDLSATVFLSARWRHSRHVPRGTSSKRHHHLFVLLLKRPRQPKVPSRSSGVSGYQSDVVGGVSILR